MKKKLLFILFFAIFIIGQAQNSDYQNMVTFSTFSPGFSRRYELGYLRETTDRIWIGAEMGLGVQGIVLKVNEETKYKSFSVKPEVFYSLAPESRLKHFVSLQPFFIKTDAHFLSSYYYEGDEYYRFASSDYTMKKYGINANYSIFLHKAGSKFGFLPKIGFGYAFVDSNYHNIEGHELGVRPTDGLPFDFSFYPMSTGRFNRFNFNLDIKFVYSF